jgi:uncharacterized protein (DUF1015 family)
MAVIRPFQGLRYSSAAGDIDSLTAPPYDVLSPAQRDDYAARNKHNIVHLTLPEQEADDRSKFVKYARSAARLAEWRRDGGLVLEEAPTIYRYTQVFSVPRMGEHFVRTSIIALIKIEPYDKGVVLPHEQTFPKHKEDRLRLLEATRAHLECIYGLYEDPTGEILERIKAAPHGSPVEAQSDEGVRHIFEPITDASALQSVTDALADRKIWIADGHHRYETALGFREALGPQDNLVPEDFMMMALSSISDPGLVLLPTHRVLNVMPVSAREAVERIQGVFDTDELHSSRLADAISAKNAVGLRAFGLALEGGLGYVLTPRDESQMLSMVEGDEREQFKSLDVTVLHKVIFEKLLGIKDLDNVSYTRDTYEAIRLADEGAAASFLMNPPSVDDMKEIALAGEKMPQKSTYYYPKILSGLVLWSLNDFANP